MSYLVSARFGAMRNISNFVSTTDELRLHDKVILRTDRGTELGEIISAPEYIMRGTDTSSYGEVLRRITKKDDEHYRNIEDNLIPTEVKFCEQIIRENKIPMKLATVEHLFGGEKVIFYFLAEGRIDFRQLVKDLAAQYHTRIEMRQIGVRDEARLLAEYEHCGQQLCCKSFMRDLQPVTMRMAKSQKTTLDPAKISGRCGRLMCCLRFEDDTYGKLKANLPSKGDQVTVKQGSGRVVAQDILGQAVTIELPDGSELKVGIEEIMRVVSQKKNGKEQQKDESGADAPQGEKPRERQEQRERREPRDEKQTGEESTDQ
ncbi:MAG TPA: regulatory iron-sulfur-containing complex subunit RicT [Planctomycetota bacterium]|nr:regulatory iron-sulfur-containing complex subunit RicT [Planctomycetota bacterium]